MRIEIAGSIGAGKSTLAHLIGDLGLTVIFENFQLNPFWKAFYSNPDKYNFETEVTFLLQHYHDIKRTIEESNDVVCDYSFLQDKAYAAMGLRETPLQIFNNTFDYIIEGLAIPDILIVLKCPMEKLIERIKLRGRKEETSIDLQFVKLLEDAINFQVNLFKDRNPNAKILFIDSDKINFVNNVTDKRNILDNLRKIL